MHNLKRPLIIGAIALCLLGAILAGYGWHRTNDTGSVYVSAGGRAGHISGNEAATLMKDLARVYPGAAHSLNQIEKKAQANRSAGGMFFLGGLLVCALGAGILITRWKKHAIRSEC